MCPSTKAHHAEQAWRTRPCRRRGHAVEDTIEEGCEVDEAQDRHAIVADVQPLTRLVEGDLEGARRALLDGVAALETRLVRALEVRVGKDRLRLERLERRLFASVAADASTRARIDVLGTRLARAMRLRVADERATVRRLEQRLRAKDPRAVLTSDRARIVALERRLERAMKGALVAPRRAVAEATRGLREVVPTLVPPRRATVSQFAASLDALSPLRVLDRGYAIALHAQSGRAIRHVRDAAKGELIEVRVIDGKVRARVE